MMKFICYEARSFTTYVKVGGKNVQVCFCNSNANTLGKGEVYVHREDLQKAMLESNRYGVAWFSPDVPDVPVVPVVPVVPDVPVVSAEKEIVVVKSVPEAKVILKERGFEKPVRLRVDAENAAKSLGFELQFAK